MLSSFHERRTSSFGSADCASFSYSTDSPLIITPEQSIATFGRKSGPGSFGGGDPSGGDISHFTQSPASGSPTQIQTERGYDIQGGSPAGSSDSVDFSTPTADSRTRSRAALPPCAPPAPASAEEPTQVAHSRHYSPLVSRFQIDAAALLTAAAAPELFGGTATAPIDSDDADDVAVGADASCYPETTPRKEHPTPHFDNPLYDESPSTIWTQPMSIAAAADSPSVSGLSPPSLASPTRRLFSLSATRHQCYRPRARHLHLHSHPHRRHDDRTAASSPCSPDGGAAATAVLAASSLLCRAALRGRSGRAGLEAHLAGYLRRQLDALRHDGIAIRPGPGPVRRLDERLDDARAGDNVGAGGGDGVRGRNPDQVFAGVAQCAGAALDFNDRAAVLQRQLGLRTEELASLRLQIEDLQLALQEAVATRDEMGLHLLNCQEYIAELERRLAEEVRARTALAAQSQLLQEQLQEACEAVTWRNQAEPDAQRQQRQPDQGPAYVPQLPGDAAAGKHPLSRAASVTLPTSAASALGPAPVSTADGAPLSTEYGSTAAAEHGGVSFYESFLMSPHSQPSGCGAGAAVGSSDGGSGGGGGDQRDVELAMLRRENNFLTQRLISSSMAAAQAREREEEERHKAFVTHELNQQYTEMINAMSLELALLRPNACGRTRGVFNLGFLRRASGPAGAASDAGNDGSRP